MDEANHFKPEPILVHPKPILAYPKQAQRKFLIISTIVLVNVVLLCFIIFQLLSPVTTTNTSDPLVGKKAPTFTSTLISPYGGQNILSLAQLSGKAVVLNFWASWCHPCQQEAPLLETTWQQIQAQGKSVVIVGIDFGETSKDGASFAQTYQLTYPLALDNNGTIGANYHIPGLPQTFFINSQGIVVSHINGQLTSENLAKGLQGIE
jgi:cytochrome c biogenesis protein CcmG/thiol:disulfide interchange protein DsbE